MKLKLLYKIKTELFGPMPVKKHASVLLISMLIFIALFLNRLAFG